MGNCFFCGAKTDIRLLLTGGWRWVCARHFTMAAAMLAGSKTSYR